VQNYVLWYENLGMDDVEVVGGKNASLGEMISNLSGMGVKVPGGFATTALAFTDFLQQSGLNKSIYDELNALDVDDVTALAAAGTKIRQAVIDAPFSEALENAIIEAFNTMRGDVPEEEYAVAVRSSATAEDLPDASFAGQQETFLNVRGLDNIMLAMKEVFASLFNDRAISYQVH
jgi:pyruvate,water dikinase